MPAKVANATASNGCLIVSLPGATRSPDEPTGPRKAPPDDKLREIRDSHRAARPPRMSLRSCGLRATLSFALDVRRPDHRPPFVDLGLVEGGERLRRLLVTRRNLLPEIAEPRADRRLGERIDDRGVELADDIFRRAPRRKQREPAGDVHAGRA